MQTVWIELSRLFAAVLVALSPGGLLLAIVVAGALTLVRVDRIEDQIDGGTHGKADRAVADE